MEKAEFLERMLEIGRLRSGGGIAKSQNQLSDYLTCRTIVQGGRIAYCPNCNDRKVFYNPCNRRGCPVCGQKNQAQWNSRIRKRLLPIEHCHLIISPPAEWTLLWLKMKTPIMNLLFALIKASFKKYQEETGLTYGLIMVFQSHGAGLCYKPHIHCILTAGGVDEGENWIKDNSVKYKKIANGVVDTLREHTVLEHFPEIYDTEPLFEEGLKEKRWGYTVVAHKNAGSIVNYLSRKMYGLLVDPKEEIEEVDGKVQLKQRHGDREVKTTLRWNDFYDRYFAHIPEKGAVVVRSYGIYSNRKKNLLAKLLKALSGEKEKTGSNEEGHVEVCPECEYPLEIVEVFTYEKQPLSLRLYQIQNKAPPEHEMSLKAS